MANCYNDCIHSFVCQYVNHDEYPSVQQLKDDCRYCHIGVDVVPKSEVDRLKAVMKEMDEQRAYSINMLGESLEKAKSEVERWRRNLEAVLEERAEEKTEVAREIFEEIENHMFVIAPVEEFDGWARMWLSDVERLKKKYTEGKENA